MIAGLAMAVWLSVAQLSEAAEGDLLDRFVGNWHGSVDYPQWMLEAAENMGGMSADDELQFQFPDLIMEIDISRQASSLEFKVLMWEAVDRPGNSSRAMWLLSFGSPIAPTSTGETLRLLATDREVSAANGRNDRNSYRYELRGQSLVWEMAALSFARSSRARIVLQPVWDRFLVLHFFFLRPRPVLVLSIYLAPCQSADTTPTRS